MRGESMRGVLPSVGRRISRAAIVGLVLGAMETVLVAIFDRQLFLSVHELLRFAAVSLLTCTSLTVLGGLCAFVTCELLRGRREGSVARFERRVAVFVGACAWPLLGLVLDALSSGRRVRDVPGRLLIVLGLSGLGAFVLGGLAARVARVSAHGGRDARVRWLLALALAVCAALALDAHVLRRLYPAYHLALASMVWLAAAAAALLSFWPGPDPGNRQPRLIAPGALACALAAPFFLASFAQAPNARFAAEQVAPLTGKLLARFGRSGTRLPQSQVERSMALRGVPPLVRDGVDLRGQDVLMITIDALRADRLRAYGGRGVTPALDALAAESVVFERAYTVTPHTSYALASLLTGKYLRPLFSLSSEPPRDHATLPRLLRRYGYRTAAFYPPAIFFVDRERFASLAADHFGFEYVKEMFAPAAERVTQVARYLEQADAGHPMFLWVHLFEPHEPYDPPAKFRAGESPAALYDGEVRAADAAVHEIVRLVRARRPNVTVIVSADHGEEFGDHGGYHHGTTLFDEQVRVPLLWSSPNQLSPRRIAAPVDLVDVAPTLLSALGIPRDARMRGDDLSALLMGAPADPALRAFASIDTQQMWSTGRHKLVCDAAGGAGACRLFDVVADPGETRDVSAKHATLAADMAAELSDFVASVPHVEALAMPSGSAFPRALARAQLGDQTVGEDVLALLGDARPAIRAQAARALGRLRYAAAVRPLSTLRAQDADAGVRDEAALAAYVLGDAAAEAQVAALLTRWPADAAEDVELVRSAALALPLSARSIDVLLAFAGDASAEESARKAALEKLAAQQVRGHVGQLLPLLQAVRLRPFVVTTLAAIGGEVAADAIADAFTRERYPEARRAQACALIALDHPRAKRLLLRFLGTEIGVPSGLACFVEAFPAHRDTRGLVVSVPAELDARAGPSRSRSVLLGDFRCERMGCVPQAGASLTPAAARLPRGALRVVIEARVAGAAQHLELGEERRLLPAGEASVSFALPAGPRPERLPLQASEGVFLRALAIVPQRPDIPPPAPEPYDAGVSAADDAAP